jgi:hexokinase
MRLLDYIVLISILSIHFQIREQCQNLILSDKDIEELMRKFLIEIKAGLGKATHKDADIKCWVTYVQDLPNGKGNFSISSLTL